MKNHKIIYASSYDRGLEFLLKMWESILKKFPDATLDICYGWDLFVTAYANNPERMKWKEKMDILMTQKGITHHGRVSKKVLDEITAKCGIWAYPTNFAEINCITALNCQKLGVVPVVINYAALKETVGSGIKIDGDIYDQETQDKFLSELLNLMSDELRLEDESYKAKNFAKDYDWENIADKWITNFGKKDYSNLIYK